MNTDSFHNELTILVKKGIDSELRTTDMITCLESAKLALGFMIYERAKRNRMI